MAHKLQHPRIKTGLWFRTTFRALTHRNYQLWFFGQGVSLIGTWMQSMAQQILVYRLTGSAVSLGIVSLMTVLPLLPFSFWGGSLADRVSKRNILLVTQTMMLLQAAILGVLTWTGLIRVWHVYLMAFLLGVLKAVDMPPRQSMIVEMVEGKEDLTSAIGLNSAIHNTARTLGPAIAGVVVAAMGEAVAFFINSISFIAVLASLLLMRNLPHKQQPKQQLPQVFAHTMEGIRYLFSQQLLLVLMSLVAVTSFLSRPYQTLLPVFAENMRSGSAQPVVEFLCNGEHYILTCQEPEALPLGMLLSAVGVGAVIGAFLVASLPERAHRGRMLTLGNLGLPVMLIAFVSTQAFTVALFLMILVGMGQVFQNALANTLLQIAAPDNLRGRVMSQYSLVTQGMHQLGGLQAGFVADWIGAPLSVGIGAAVSLAYGVFVVFRFPRVREMA
ncbi:MAG TPA: MFS transporter [Anaerolineales bacterium]|nr:MFS transporter [Anaerolineales bacterium]